jgi:Rubrerythrin
MPKSFADLDEREILALAISLEEEDSRIYRDLTERMKEKNPEIAPVLQSMYEGVFSSRAIGGTVSAPIPKAYRLMATESGPAPAGKGESATGVRAPFSSI